FLVRRVDERQVFLPVVVKAKRSFLLGDVRLGGPGAGGNTGGSFSARGGLRTHRKILVFSRGSASVELSALGQGRFVLGDGGSDLISRLERDGLAAAQPRAELAVVDGEPSEGRFGHPRPAAERLDFGEQRFRAWHAGSFLPSLQPGMCR